MTLSGEAQKAVLNTNIDAVTAKTGVKEWSHARKNGFSMSDHATRYSKSCVKNSKLKGVVAKKVFKNCTGFFGYPEKMMNLKLYVKTSKSEYSLQRPRVHGTMVLMRNIMQFIA